MQVAANQAPFCFPLQICEMVHILEWSPLSASMMHDCILNCCSACDKEYLKSHIWYD